MYEKKFRTWRAFEREIRRKLRTHRQSNIDTAEYDLIFRGQSDASWHLETSLERYWGENQLVSGYLYEITNFRSRIETFTERKWDDLDSSDIEQWIIDHWEADSEIDVDEFPAYEYMTYLRHHGYPSPLLDWSYSPFVAAYFAFRDISSKAKYVSVYSYSQPSIERIFEHYIRNTPKILILRKGVRANKRHYLQQSVYTICLKEEEGELIYANHEKEKDSDNENLGVTKYVLPSSERVEALRSLESYNINAYSLFGTEESLLETISIRDYIEMKENEEQIDPLDLLPDI